MITMTNDGPEATLVLDEQPIQFDRAGLLHIVFDDGASLQIEGREFLSLAASGIEQLLDHEQNRDENSNPDAFTPKELKRLGKIMTELNAIVAGR